MNNIIAVARDKEKILATHTAACCPACGSRWFSPFDKLFVAAYGKCTTCSTEAEVTQLSANIFRIL